MIKIGDEIRIVGLPDGLIDDEQFQTKSLFERCLGRVFPVVGVQPVPEIGDLLELHVGEVLGEASYMHSVWIETAFVEAVRESK